MAFKTARSVRFGAFELDSARGDLHKHGVKVKLQEQPLRVLAMLLEHPGETVTREELRERIWPAVSNTFVDFENGLNTAVGKLRQALGDSAHGSRYIETVPRRGYRFIADIEAAGSLTEISPRNFIIHQDALTCDTGVAETAAATQIQPVATEGTDRKSTVFSRLALLAGALVLLGILFGLNADLLRDRVFGRFHQTGIRSIAVLPLQNLSGLPDQEFLADGITDELTTDLARIASLKVISRTSAMHYKGTTKPLRQIARELGVDAVVEGSVARSEGTIRVRTQLIDAVTDRHVWAQAYERNMQDVVALQSEVAQAIADQIRVKVTPSEQRLLAGSGRPVDPDTYELYLRGRNHLNLRNLPRSIEFFQQAARRDPNCDLAYAGLADAYSLLGNYNMLRPVEAYPVAKAAARRALQINENLAEAHASLAFIGTSYDWDWSNAEANYKRAIQLNPNYATAHHWYARHLTAMGRHQEAIREIQRARELDPLSPNINAGPGEALYFARQFEPAIKAEQTALEFDPSLGRAHFVMGQICLETKAFDQAIAELRVADAYYGHQSISLAELGYAYGISGRKSESGKVLQELAKRSKESYVPSGLVAAVYMGLGDTDRALTWLEKGYAERDLWLVSLKVDPRFDALRSNPRFQDLLYRMKFPVH